MATELAKKNIYSVEVKEAVNKYTVREWNGRDSDELHGYDNREVVEKSYKVSVYKMDTYEMEAAINQKVSEIWEVVKDFGNAVSINKEKIFVDVETGTTKELVHQCTLKTFDNTFGYRAYICTHKGIRGEYVNGRLNGGKVNYDMYDPDSYQMISSGEWLTDDDYELCCIVQDYIKSTGKWDDRYDIETR